MISRRHLLGAACSVAYGARYLLAEKNEVWNAKPAAEWSDADVQRILTKSPWVKEVSVTFSSPGGGSGGGMGGRGGGGMGGRGGGGGGMSGGGGMPQLQATVRWETAHPIREALKKPAPDGWDAVYVISVTGLPMMGGGRRGQRPNPGLEFQQGDQTPGGAAGDPEQRRQAMIASLKQATSLTVKGREPEAPTIVEMTPDQQRPVIVFAFPRKEFPLTTNDKEVTFTTHIARFDVKAKFTLKEMLYHGKLDL